MSASWAVLAMAVLLGSAPSAVELSDVRLAVVVGNNVGLEGERPLDFAEEDARRVHQMLVEIGGVAADRAYLLIGATAEALQRALDEVTGRLKELSGGASATVIVYVSSHADDEGLHLSGTTFKLAELRGGLRRMPASLRLIIVDACRTAASIHRKGGSPGPEVEVAFDRSVQVAGDVFIASAAQGEPAQEWPYLRGALFTSHLLTGLRGAGDLDEDGRVSLAEAYTYAYRRTAAQALSGGAGQHPTFDVQMSGWGDWPMTRPSLLGASIVLEKALAGEILIANRRNELVAEVVKSAGDQVRVAVKPGWYRVVRPEGTAARVAEVNLWFGGEQALDERSFVRRSLKQAMRRGSQMIELRPWSVGIGYAAAAGPVAGIRLEHLGEVTGARQMGDWELRLGLGVTSASFRGVNQSIAQRQARLRLGGGYGFPVYVATFGVGAELATSWAYQKFRRDDALEAERVLGHETAPRQGWILSGCGLGWVAFPFTDRLSGRVETLIGVQGTRLADGSIMARLAVEGRVGALWAF